MGEGGDFDVEGGEDRGGIAGAIGGGFVVSYAGGEGGDGAEGFPGDDFEGEGFWPGALEDREGSGEALVGEEGDGAYGFVDGVV